MFNTKCLTTIESALESAVSRVAPKPMWCEKRRVFVNAKIVIWSDLHGDMQRLKRAGLVLRPKLNIMSSDLFLGLPYNIASYALLTHIIAQVVGMAPEQLIVTLGDSHIYKNHFDQVNELLSRDLNKHPASTLIFNRKITDIDDISLDDFEVVGYQSYAAIAAPVAI